MQDSKFNFSNNEIRLMSNQVFFNQKNNITQKLIGLFHELNNNIELLKEENENCLPLNAKSISGKISKGENYLGLPYIVLDNPRIFSKQNIFAFRTMFWWGNYFSFTFHLSGKHLEDSKKNILKNFRSLKKKQFLVCINSEEWIHHLEKDNFISIDSFDKNALNSLIEKYGFLKISRKADLEKYKYVPAFGTEALKEYLSLIRS